MHETRWIGLGLLVAAGCAEPSLPPVEGDHHQYVVGGLRIPETNAEARENSLDLNGDRAIDNQLGMVFGVLATSGLGVADTAEEALVRGNAIMLVDVQATSFVAAPYAGLVTYLGANPDPAACTDPSQLATCGQHLMTRASYDVSPGTASDLARGGFDDGIFSARVGTMPIEIALDAEAAPLRVDLHAARVELRNMSADGGTAILAGGITTADVQAIVIPEAARQMSRIVASECSGRPAGESPCGCGSGSRARDLESFDTDHDCVIEALELRDSTLVQSLTLPDLRIDGEELLSFGFGVDLVPASFTPPAPAAE